MSELMAEGLGLMGFGMGTVFLFLIVLIFATTLMSKLINKFFPEAPAAPAAPAMVQAASVDPQLLSVLKEAVKEHRSRQK
jgi:oxaloacetate decarboxylase gamma subunit